MKVITINFIPGPYPKQKLSVCMTLSKHLFLQPVVILEIGFRGAVEPPET